MSIMQSDKRNLVAASCVICALAIAGSGCTRQVTRQRLAFAKYPNLKLGFTTANFLKAMPVTLESSKRLIDYASEQGYAWIELRDPHADLSVDECRQIAEYAGSKKIEIGYAIHEGLLDDTFLETLKRGVKNASYFEGPKTIRALICGNEFVNNESKIGWTADELNRAVLIGDRAAQIARNNGLHLVVENGFEVIKGDGKGYYGTKELFERAGPDLGWQFDTGNFFCTSRVWTKPQEAEDFLKKNISKVRYIHLKTSQGRTVQPVLGDNELDFDTIFSVMSKNNVLYVAIEIVGFENIHTMYVNHDKSVQYLRSKGFVTIK